MGKAAVTGLTVVEWIWHNSNYYTSGAAGYKRILFAKLEFDF